MADDNSDGRSDGDVASVAHENQAPGVDVDPRVQQLDGDVSEDEDEEEFPGYVSDDPLTPKDDGARGPDDAKGRERADGKGGSKNGKSSGATSATKPFQFRISDEQLDLLAASRRETEDARKAVRAAARPYARRARNTVPEEKSTGKTRASDLTLGNKEKRRDKKTETAAAAPDPSSSSPMDAESFVPGDTVSARAKDARERREEERKVRTAQNPRVPPVAGRRRADGELPSEGWKGRKGWRVASDANMESEAAQDESQVTNEQSLVTAVLPPAGAVPDSDPSDDDGGNDDGDDGGDGDDGEDEDDWPTEEERLLADDHPTSVPHNVFGTKVATGTFEAWRSTRTVDATQLALVGSATRDHIPFNVSLKGAYVVSIDSDAFEVLEHDPIRLGAQITLDHLYQSAKTVPDHWLYRGRDVIVRGNAFGDKRRMFVVGTLDSALVSGYLGLERTHVPFSLAPTAPELKEFADHVKQTRKAYTDAVTPELKKMGLWIPEDPTKTPVILDATRATAPRAFRAMLSLANTGHVNRHAHARAMYAACVRFTVIALSSYEYRYDPDRYMVPLPIAPFIERLLNDQRGLDAAGVKAETPLVQRLYDAFWAVCIWMCGVFGDGDDDRQTNRVTIGWNKQGVPVTLAKLDGDDVPLKCAWCGKAVPFSESTRCQFGDYEAAINEALEQRAGALPTWKLWASFTRRVALVALQHVMTGVIPTGACTVDPADIHAVRQVNNILSDNRRAILMERFIARDESAPAVQ